MRSHNSYTLSSSNSTPNAQSLNKQGDGISEVELNSLKQFKKRRSRRGRRRWQQTAAFQGLLQGVYLLCLLHKGYMEIRELQTPLMACFEIQKRLGGGEEETILSFRERTPPLLLTMTVIVI
jgi:hypothetical protein